MEYHPARMRAVIAAIPVLLTPLVAACASQPAPCPAAAPQAPLSAAAPPPACPSASASVAAVPQAAASASASTPAPAPPSAPPPAAFTTALDAANKAIAAGDYATADKQLDAAASAASSDAHLRFLVAHERATRFVSAHDFEHAAAAFVAVIPELARHPESSDEFWAHNAMMMIREAQGDPAAALAEDDQATLAAARGTWGDTPQERETLAYLKDRWHRAYLTRMLAETRKGTARQALLGYAQAALEDYRARAHQLGDYQDSVAILDAYFAALAGDGAAALRAAKQVDPAKDDDVEDLYLVFIGLDAGGDRAGAQAVARRMRAAPGPHISRSIMLSWLDHDARWPADRTFTPRHPAP